MNRRTYLGFAAAGVVGTVAGCTEATDRQEFPPYPDSNSTELSGDGPMTSESFELSLDGPTVIELEHMGSDNFTVILDEPPADDNDTDGNETVDDTDGNETANDTDGNETLETNGNETVEPDGNGSDTDDNATDPENGEELDLEAITEDGQINPVASVASATGPYNGSTLHSVESGEYVLHVLEADDEWEATVYDLPAYDDGTGSELPIEHDGEQYDVVGPIDFGDRATVEFEFSVTGEGLHRVFLTDRTGTESLSVAELEGDGDESVSQEVSGVGYIEVLTVFSWNLEVS